jgi:hypothetical protein
MEPSSERAWLAVDGKEVSLGGVWVHHQLDPFPAGIGTSW